MSGHVNCPICSQADQIAKVSTLYIKGIESKHGGRDARSAGANSPAAPLPEFFEALSPDEIEDLSKKLTPPASKSEAFSRPIHPDQVVLIFSLIAPVFLYGVWTSQPASLALMLLILAAFYGLYFWRRKALIRRFEQRQLSRKDTNEKVHAAVERWMRLYYCARDESVFDPKNGASAPVDQMAWLVFKD